MLPGYLLITEFFKKVAVNLTVITRVLLLSAWNNKKLNIVFTFYRFRNGDTRIEDEFIEILYALTARLSGFNLPVSPSLGEYEILAFLTGRNKVSWFRLLFVITIITMFVCKVGDFWLCIQNYCNQEWTHTMSIHRKSITIRQL